VKLCVFASISAFVSATSVLFVSGPPLGARPIDPQDAIPNNFSVYGGTIQDQLPAILAPAENVEGAVSPVYIVEKVKASGLKPLTSPVRIGSTYVLSAVEHDGTKVIVVLGAAFGGILGTYPIAAGRPHQTAGHSAAPLPGIDPSARSGRAHSIANAVSPQSVLPVQIPKQAPPPLPQPRPLAMKTNVEQGPPRVERSQVSPIGHPGTSAISTAKAAGELSSHEPSNVPNQTPAGEAADADAFDQCP
jgi:hypothetical protein